MTKAVAGLFGAPWIDNQSSSKKQIQKPITSTLQSTRGAAPMQKLYFMLLSIDVDNLYMRRANGRHLGPGLLIPLLALARTAALLFQGLVLLAARGHARMRIHVWVVRVCMICSPSRRAPAAHVRVHRVWVVRRRLPAPATDGVSDTSARALGVSCLLLLQGVPCACITRARKYRPPAERRRVPHRFPAAKTVLVMMC